MRQDSEALSQLDEEFIESVDSLSQSEIDNLESIADSLTKKYDAEAQMESQKKFRVLFERTAVEHLPFIIYCIYVGFWGGISVFQLTNYTGQQLLVIGGLVALVMILPLFVLPKKSVKSVLNRFVGDNND